MIIAAARGAATRHRLWDYRALAAAARSPHRLIAPRYVLQIHNLNYNERLFLVSIKIRNKSNNLRLYYAAQP